MLLRQASHRARPVTHSLFHHVTKSRPRTISSSSAAAVASSILHRNQKSSDPNSTIWRNVTAGGVVLFGTAGLLTLGNGVVQAEAALPRGETRLVEWDEMVQRLRVNGGGFNIGSRKVRRKGGDWEYGIEFEGEEGCDIFGAISTAIAEFGGDGLKVKSRGNGNGMILEIGGEDGKGFGMRVSCLRWGGMKPRVEMRFVVGEGEEILLEEKEVQCIEKVFEKTRKRAGVEQEQTRGITIRGSFPGFGNGEDMFGGLGGFDEEIQKFFKEAEELMMGQIGPGLHQSGGRITFGDEDGIIEDEESADPRYLSGQQGSRDQRGSKDQRAARAKKKLVEGFGVQVYDSDNKLDWDVLAGYDDVKQHIDNTLILPMRHPEIYEKIVEGTRVKAESNLPKAVLFEGSPGCGKTSAAKVLASGAGMSFVHIPLESILSKYYGESTQRLSSILETANELGRCLIFIDEIDSLGSSRDAEDSHEASRRVLSVLLRHLDGIEGPKNSILCAATNRRDDLDSALLSRFDVVISFPLPDAPTRAKILARYAKHLSEDERRKLAEDSEGFSGRELQDACEEAERSLAGRVVRSQNERKFEDEELLPEFNDYVAAIGTKAKHAIGRKPKKQAIPEVLKSSLFAP